MPIDFKIITPEKTVLQKQIDSLTCPTAEGEITILPKHIPLVGLIRHGELTVRIGQDAEYYAVSGGFVEVRPGSEVVILADTAEHAREIDVQRAEAARKAAEESMRERTNKLSMEEYVALEATLQKNIARLKVAQRREHYRAKHGVGSEGIFKE